MGAKRRTVGLYEGVRSGIEVCEVCGRRQMASKWRWDYVQDLL